MMRAMSTYVYVKQRLHPGLLDGLVRGGAEAIEIFAARDHLDYANRKQHVREIAQWFQSSGIPLNSVHSPLFSDYEWGRSGSAPINIADLDRKRRIEAMDEIKRALEIAEQIPFRLLVQHMGTGGADCGGVGVGVDLGHGQLKGGVVQACATLSGHIRSTHVHDNARERDSHLWRGEGSINWPEAMKLWRTA